MLLNSIIHFKLKTFVIFPINHIAILKFLLPSFISYPSIFLVIFIFSINSLRSIQNCGIQPIIA